MIEPSYRRTLASGREKTTEFPLRWRRQDHEQFGTLTQKLPLRVLLLVLRVEGGETIRKTRDHHLFKEGFPGRATPYSPSWTVKRPLSLRPKTSGK